MKQAMKGMGGQPGQPGQAPNPFGGMAGMPGGMPGGMPPGFPGMPGQMGKGWPPAVDTTAQPTGEPHPYLRSVPSYHSLPCTRSCHFALCCVFALCCWTFMLLLLCPAKHAVPCCAVQRSAPLCLYCCVLLQHMAWFTGPCLSLNCFEPQVHSVVRSQSSTCTCLILRCHTLMAFVAYACAIKWHVALMLFVECACATEWQVEHKLNIIGRSSNR